MRQEAIDEKLNSIWESKFWDAVGCGHSADQAGRIAGAAVKDARASLLAEIERLKNVARKAVAKC